ncbi:MAG: peptide deformylase [Sedimentisphaerales bacterium]|nr:peptide deformylase [Sedimentisphaerales bacterium]
MTDIDVDKCHITHYPANVLTGPAQPVEKIDETVRRLVAKMTDLMIEHKGVGFAAPQAGVPLRLFIISLDGTKEKVRVYINPVVKPEGNLVQNEEGCLSVPGVYAKIKRFGKATVTATDLEGKSFTEQADGLYARALQHEFDHIEGVTIVNRMPTVARIAYRKQLKKLEEEQIENG